MIKELDLRWILSSASLARLATALFFAAIAASIWTANRFCLDEKGHLVRWSSRVVGGDEPHYMLVVNSILFDHDLALGTDYYAAAAGGKQAGESYSSQPLDHHTFLYDPQTHESVLWASVYDYSHPIRENGRLIGFRPWGKPSLDPTHALERSSHPVGFPALMAGCLALLRATRATSERDFNWVQQFLTFLGVILTFLLCRQASLGRAAALLASVTLLIASPWLAYSRSYFAETTLGVLLALGAYAWIRRQPVLAAVPIALSMWIKPHYGIIAVVWFCERIYSKDRKSALSLAIVIGVNLLGIVAFDKWLVGRWLVSGNWVGWEWARGLYGFHTQFFEAEHGLLVFVPWVIFGLIWIASGAFSAGPASFTARTLGLPVVAYTIMVSSQPYGGGWCYGPRYWVCMLPWLTVASFMMLRQAGWFPRTLFVLLAVVAMYTTAVPATLRYPWIFHRPVNASWPI